MLDTIIIGGGAAGLTAALYLGRFRRKVALFDNGKQANRFSHAAHGFFTRDGTAPSELIEIGHEQLRQYETVTIQSGTVSSIKPSDEHFTLNLDDGTHLTSRKILLATGLKDNIPDIQGLEALWGRSVFHCPYCDGYEMRDQPIAIIGHSATGLHYAKLLRLLTDDIVLCTDGSASPTGEELDALQSYDVKIIESPIERLEGNNEQLEAIVFTDGQKLERKAIFLRPHTEQAAPFAEQLGLKMDENHLVEIDEFGRSSVSGVYAAGDMAARMRQLVIAVMQGASAAIGINNDLIDEDFELGEKAPR
jgi:thioredoxin reductase